MTRATDPHPHRCEIDGRCGNHRPALRPASGIGAAQDFPTKIGHAWADGTLRERVVRKLGVELSTALGTAARYAALTREERALNLAAGFADHRPAAAVGGDGDREVLERITAAYRAARADQPRAAKPFAVRGVWAEWLAVNFGSLVRAVEGGDRAALGALLADFDREPFARGIAGSYVDVVRYRRSLLGPWYVRTLWCQHRRKLAAEGLDAAELSSPNVGNPAGVLLGDRVISVEMLRYAHHAVTAARLLRDVDEPVVMEIGGGFGGQAYQIVDQARRRGAPVRLYLDFDLPEVLMVASYFMLKALPGLCFRLYGEGPVTADPAAGFDVGLFPHFAIDRVEDGSADLVFNTHSLSEMDELASRHYLAVVNRACRRYFMHANHEKRLVFRQPDGTRSRNLVGPGAGAERAGVQAHLPVPVDAFPARRPPLSHVRVPLRARSPAPQRHAASVRRSGIAGADTRPGPRTSRRRTQRRRSPPHGLCVSP